MKLKPSLYRRQQIFVWCCIVPAAAFFLVFFMVPILQTVLGSFQNWNALTGQAKMNGLENYKTLFRDNLFYKSMANTFLLTFL